jgi:hypothetical protein
VSKVEETKAWWMSKIYWAQIISIIFVVGSRFDWWPSQIDQREVLEAVILGINILTMIFRKGVSTKIGKPDNSVG